MNPSSILLRITGLVFVVLGLLYNEVSISWLQSGLVLEPSVITAIRRTEGTYILVGLTLILIAALTTRIKWLGRLSTREIFTSITLLLLVLIMPIATIELALRPFSNGPSKTTIFIQDPELGWRLRPNHEGVWGGVPVSINSRGLRGPEIPYQRTPGRHRVLFLGDSVTFGYMLPTDEATFPRQIGKALENQFGTKVETVNAGVGGYSPWQEYEYLASEGIRYQPDLVVVSFVLNDVTEKFRLLRFGGDWAGYQLAHTAISQFDRLAAKSAVILAIRQWRAETRFGANVQQGAVNYSAMNDWSLISEADSPRVQRAWDLTLQNLGQIAEFCEAREIPLLVMAFPSSYQFQDIELYGIPQRILKDFGHRAEIQTVDLLPLLAEKARQQAESPFDYFLDENHVSGDGSKAVAEIVAPLIAARLRHLPTDTWRDQPTAVPLSDDPVQIASR